MKKAVRAISNELRRSLLSMRFLITLAICLGVLYQPVFYLREVGQGFRGMDMLNAIMSTMYRPRRFCVRSPVQTRMRGNG